MDIVHKKPTDRRRFVQYLLLVHKSPVWWWNQSLCSHREIHNAIFPSDTKIHEFSYTVCLPLGYLFLLFPLRWHERKRWQSRHDEERGAARNESLKCSTDDEHNVADISLILSQKYVLVRRGTHIVKPFYLCFLLQLSLSLFFASLTSSSSKYE